MRLTIIHPCIGRHRGDRSYMRTWQMESLPAAVIAGLTPSDVDVKFYDDRMESIPFDEPTDLVAISVETYTARRAYQIASDYRQRRVPVVMGGFHPSLCPDEVARFAESVVIGEAEGIWPEVIDDYRHGTPRKFYRATARPSLRGLRPDRRIFAGKRYVKLGLVEAGRGCQFHCEFCAVQSMFHATQTRRPPDEIVAELAGLRDCHKLFFFVDDNITSNLSGAKELLRALAPLQIRWVSQASINAAHDEEFLDLLVQSGCAGVLIGFETLNGANLTAMNKGFNTMAGGYVKAIDNLRRRQLGIYGTFIFGYDHDTPATFDEATTFAEDQGLFIAAFNHLTPFPGTPLYDRLAKERRLLYDAWWLDPRYRYNAIPYQPRLLSPEALQRGCLEARQRFYRWGGIWRRRRDPMNRADAFMRRNFFLINTMIRREVTQRDGLPLGDESWNQPWIEAS
jgi:radical SAM superfamily enzyme YgiQ (UPF0313 family)